MALTLFLYFWFCISNSLTVSWSKLWIMQYSAMPYSSIKLCRCVTAYLNLYRSFICESRGTFSSICIRVPLGHLSRSQANSKTSLTSGSMESWSRLDGGARKYLDFTWLAWTSANVCSKMYRGSPSIEIPYYELSPSNIGRGISPLSPPWIITS